MEQDEPPPQNFGKGIKKVGSFRDMINEELMQADFGKQKEQRVTSYFGK